MRPIRPLPGASLRAASAHLSTTAFSVWRFNSPRAFWSPTWTCNHCLRFTTLKSRPTQLNHSASPLLSTRSIYQYNKSQGTKFRKRRRNVPVVLAALGGAALVGCIIHGDDLPHAIHAVERAGRVAAALAVCINDYRVTLKTAEGDPENADTLLAGCHQRCADRTYKVLEKNGSIFIKLGQHLAAMGYLLPTEWTTTFIPLQDKCPVSSFESIKNMIHDDTGSSIVDLFEWFDPQPIGAASLAQVHRAKLKGSGREWVHENSSSKATVKLIIGFTRVAVKLQHPALAEWIPLDIALTRFTFSNIKYFFPEYPMEWLSDEIQRSLPHELNFEQEAYNIRRIREHFKNIRNCPLVVPDVVWAKPRILVMDYLPGHRLDDLKWMDSSGISRDEVSAALARIFNEMIFGIDAPLHCDPHAGNLAIRFNPKKRKPRNFDIILYDHGLYRDIPTDLRRSYAKLWLAVIDADEEKMRKYAKEVAHVRDDQFHLFASAITGRDYTVLAKSVSTPRSADEKAEITNSLRNEGMLAQLVQLLAGVPPIILLILKTNDLTRSLDEILCTSSVGPERTFMILARYCTRTVYQEQMEAIWNSRAGSFSSLLRWVKALWGYWRITIKLKIFETLLFWRRRLGFEVKHFSGYSVATTMEQ